MKGDALSNKRCVIKIFREEREMKEEEENGIQENKKKDEDFSFERSKGSTVDFLMLILYIDNFVQSNFFFNQSYTTGKNSRSKDNQNIRNKNIFIIILVI